MILPRGSLKTRLAATTEHALRTGALVPLGTTGADLDDASGVRFLVRIQSTLRKKDEARKQQAMGTGPRANPFLPPEPDLFVAQVSDTHAAILNKFSVVENHLLLVTKSFEAQEMLLTLEDFVALWACLREYESLGFYNGGREAGASQPHKHLQLVPLPLAAGQPAVPMAALLPATAPDTLTTAPALPFVHSFVRLAGDALTADHGASEAFDLYCAMLGHAGMTPADRAGPRRQSMPYCFLVTREWMLLVPRTRECFENISLNSLAFAGSLFVRNEAQLARLRATGAMNALRAVTLPRG